MPAMSIRCRCPLWEPCRCGDGWDVVASGGVSRPAFRVTDPDEQEDAA